MRQTDIKIPVKEYEYSELGAADRQLTEAAQQATYRSYAPYSRFNVGAAIALDNGQIIDGANQENVAFPSGTCAERTAAYYAHARFPEAKFVKIAIAARGADGKFVAAPIAPCGACRQALLEYEMLAGHDVPVMLCADNRVLEFPSVKSLLPCAFTEF